MNTATVLHGARLQRILGEDLPYAHAGPANNNAPPP